MATATAKVTHTAALPLFRSAMNVPTKTDREDFALYCRQCTANQLRVVHEKEKLAYRQVYAAIAHAELVRRGHEPAP